MIKAPLRYTFVDKVGDLTRPWFEYFRTVEAAIASSIEDTKIITFTDSPYILTSDDIILFADTNDGAITFLLPSGISGKKYEISNVGSSGNDLTVTPNATEKLFNGAAGEAFIMHDYEGITIHFKTTYGWR